MSFILNEYDVQHVATALARECGPTPNLDAAAATLVKLVAWTNDNSDGWPYWRKPSRAAALLQTSLNRRVLHAYQTGDGIVDATPAEVRAWQKPIKSFLTSQGVDHAAIIVTPEA